MSKLTCDVTVVNEENVKKARENKSDLEIIVKLASLFKALGNDTRLSIVDLLKDQELCVCDIAVVLDMTQSAISHQLSKLKKYDIVKSRREGLSIYYSLVDEHIKDIYLKAYTHICDC